MSQDVVLGVSVAIPAPHGQILAAARERTGDPQAHLVPPHVTLLPPTHVVRDDLPAIEAHLAAAAQSVNPFAMHLAGTGTFRPVSPVVFVQVAAGLAACELLEAAIRRGPLTRTLDFPYHPHVTVAQGVSEGALDDVYDGLHDFVARFEVRAFTMFERDGDGAWQPRKEFPLGA